MRKLNIVESKIIIPHFETEVNNFSSKAEKIIGGRNDAEQVIGSRGCHHRTRKGPVSHERAEHRNYGQPERERYSERLLHSNRYVPKGLCGIAKSVVRGGGGK